MIVTPSAKRRMRDRRSTIRQCQKRSIDVKAYLFNACLSVDTYTFNPQVELILSQLKAVEVCRNYECAVLASSSTLQGHMPWNQMTSVTGVRRKIRSECTAEQLPALPCVDVSSIVVNSAFVPERYCSRQPCTADVLPELVTPAFASCIVREVGDARTKLVSGDRRTLSRPARVYKHSHGNKTLRGLDNTAIGDGHVHSDLPMQIDGDVNVLETSSSRVRVRGYARPCLASSAHHVRGWIVNEAFEEDNG